ncbi:transcriptional regulator [Cupriavidus sp. DL-D2]|uniref:transcriptional regulator n=1 Tax=Cupriavidus sp. DL-D2 TaxID=3144974 RepID=UPI003212D9B8
MIDPKNLETWLHEKASTAHDALKADPARAVSANRVRYTLDELLAEAKAASQHPLPPEQREWVDAPAVGRELLPEDLQTAEAIAAFLADAEATADPAYIQHAREVVARARAMHCIK